MTKLSTSNRFTEKGKKSGKIDQKMKKVENRENVNATRKNRNIPMIECNNGKTTKETIEKSKINELKNLNKKQKKTERIEKSQNHANKIKMKANIEIINN